MSDQHLLTRREFTLESALAINAAATITITGCGDDDATTDWSSGQGEVGTISDNHGHTVTITTAQITAGGAYRRHSGTAHPHTISLTAAQVVSIGQNQRVSVVSTTDDPTTTPSRSIEGAGGKGAGGKGAGRGGTGRRRWSRFPVSLFVVVS